MIANDEQSNDGPYIENDYFQRQQRPADFGCNLVDAVGFHYLVDNFVLQHFVILLPVHQSMPFYHIVQPYRLQNRGRHGNRRQRNNEHDTTYGQSTPRQKRTHEQNDQDVSDQRTGEGGGELRVGQGVLAVNDGDEALVATPAEQLLETPRIGRHERCHVARLVDRVLTNVVGVHHQSPVLQLVPLGQFRVQRCAGALADHQIAHASIAARIFGVEDRLAVNNVLAVDPTGKALDLTHLQRVLKQIHQIRTRIDFGVLFVLANQLQCSHNFVINHQDTKDTVQKEDTTEPRQRRVLPPLLRARKE
mmetsp:Transcript_16698/g.24683  ORF Transcript_16698/g.24683 Transcript_16698/m.24683 type:complete len:305 (+) Transcript_16698:1356-2270(+)